MVRRSVELDKEFENVDGSATTPGATKTMSRDKLLGRILVTRARRKAVSGPPNASDLVSTYEGSTSVAAADRRQRTLLLPTSLAVGT